MKIRFWSSTQYSGFLEGLMRELTAAGFDAEQCYQISEVSYRSAKSGSARLFLRFRQYVAYPIQLCVVLVLQWIRFISCRLFGYRFLQRETRKLKTGQLRARDVCVVSTNTFYAPLIATYLHPHVVHLVYDLFPEAMIHSGKWTEGTLKVKFIRWITTQTLKRVKTNVFLGERLKTYVESIHGPVPNSAIIAVGADQALFRVNPKQRVESEGVRGRADVPIRCPQINEETVTTFPPSHSSRESSPTILYCGNFGNMHDSATLFDFWKRSSDVLQPSSSSDVLQPSSSSDALQPSSSVTDATIETTAEARRYDLPTFNFFCSGPKRAALEAELVNLPDVLKKQIQLGGGLDQDAWVTTMEQADVALVTMVPGSETVVMPSKTYSAMMAGQAILAIAPEDSDLVDLIKAADCGWWVAPGDVAGLAEVIEALSADPEGLLEKRENAYQYAHAYLGQDALVKQWMRALNKG